MTHDNLNDFLIKDFINDIKQRYAEISQLRKESSFEAVVDKLTTQSKELIEFNDKQVGERGYCLWAFLLPLWKQRKQYGVHNFIPNDMGKHTRIIHFFEHIKNNYSQFLKPVPNGYDIGKFIDENNIESGAIILVGEYKDENSHVYLYINEDNNKKMMSFNNEVITDIRQTNKDIFILDIIKMIKQQP